MAAALTFAFEGTAVRLHYLMFWNFGIFDVFVDDQLVATIDGYSAASELGTSQIFELAPGPHTLRIQNTGRANEAAQGVILGVDAVDVRPGGPDTPPPGTEAATDTPDVTEAPTAEATEPATPEPGPEVTAPADETESGWTRYEAESAPVVLGGTWEAIDSPTVSGGQYVYAEGADASATLTFTGDAVRLNYLRYWNFGIFGIYIDGAIVATIITAWRRSANSPTELAPGPHTLTVTNTGQATKSQGADRAGLHRGAVTSPALPRSAETSAHRSHRGTGLELTEELTASHGRHGGTDCRSDRGP